MCCCFRPPRPFFWHTESHRTQAKPGRPAGTRGWHSRCVLGARGCDMKRMLRARGRKGKKTTTGTKFCWAPLQSSKADSTSPRRAEWVTREGGQPFPHGFRHVTHLIAKTSSFHLPPSAPLRSLQAQICCRARPCPGHLSGRTKAMATSGGGQQQKPLLLYTQVTPPHQGPACF